MASVTPARAIAFDVVLATFEDGAFTDVAFRERADAAGLEGRERAQSQRLAYGSVQRRGTTDPVIADLGRRSPAKLDPPVRAALRLGLYELLFADGGAEHAIVSQAVELARQGGAPQAAGMVNAVMRRAGRERDRLRATLTDDSDPAKAARAHSAPVWLAQRWWEELSPERARSLLASANEPAEHGLRVNTMRWSPEDALAALVDAGVDATPATGRGPLAAPEMLVARGRIGPALPMIARGDLAPQSRGSAAVVEVLDPQPGEAILDMCAGPGVKTIQMAVRMKGRGEIIAIEPDEARAGDIAAAAELAGVRSVTVFEVDGRKLEAPFARTFDRVLLDAPCSDLGALASRPDARWRKTPQAVTRLAELQRELLAVAAEKLRPGGVLVYSTCTISRAENEDNVAALLAASERGEVAALEPDGEPLQIFPDEDGTTGFFIVRLRRKANGG